MKVMHLELSVETDDEMESWILRNMVVNQLRICFHETQAGVVYWNKLRVRVLDDGPNLIPDPNGGQCY